MNTTNPTIFDPVDIDCPDEYIVLTSIELGVYLEDLE